MSGIAGKVVAITGASSGIGRATALQLARGGAKVVLGARGIERLEALEQEIVTAGGEAAFLSVNVTQRDDLTSMVAMATQRFGRLDVLVSNAGIGPISSFDALKVDDWEAMIDVNVKGVLYGIAAALPVFRAQGTGHFINIISTAGIRIVPNQGVYAASKNAVRTITEALRQEAGDRLRVTGISPGYVKTEFTSTITDPAIRESLANAGPDIAMSPDAVARAVVFAIEQPAEVDVGDIVLRPTAQG